MSLHIQDKARRANGTATSAAQKGNATRKANGTASASAKKAAQKREAKRKAKRCAELGTVPDETGKKKCELCGHEMPVYGTSLSPMHVTKKERNKERNAGD